MLTNSGNEILIYQTDDKETRIDVKLEHETVWLTQRQMADLFKTTPQNITIHLKKIYREKELQEFSTCKEYLQVQKEGKREVKRKQQFYNLDAIISIGYRINSIRGTQFRQWATQRLKDYIVKGYTINEKRLQDTRQRFTELKKTIKLLENVVLKKELSTDEATGLLRVVTDYSYALDTLDRYDHQTLKKPVKRSKEKFRITYHVAINTIKTLKKKFGGSSLFGNEKDDSFKSSIENIYLTFNKKELYRGVEIKAANLLYFVVKNHSFTDGNKRIAAFLFVWFLNRNGLLYSKEGIKIIDNNTLVALTLMIAESNPEDKDMMVNVILNLMQNKND